MFVYSVYLVCVYINEHKCMYTFQKNVHILNILIYKHVKTCKYFPNTVYTVCVYLYIYIYIYIYKINKYTQYTHILCKQKLLFWI